MRSRYVYSTQGELVYAEERGVVTVDKRDYSTDPGYMVMPDISPYKSVTGEYIGGRRQHREFLKANDLVEVGNERRKPRAMPDVGGRREAIIESAKKLGFLNR